MWPGFLDAINHFMTGLKVLHSKQEYHLGDELVFYWGHEMVEAGKFVYEDGDWKFLPNMSYIESYTTEG